MEKARKQSNKTIAWKWFMHTSVMMKNTNAHKVEGRNASVQMPPRKGNAPHLQIWADRRSVKAIKEIPTPKMSAAVSLFLQLPSCRDMSEALVVVVGCVPLLSAMAMNGHTLGQRPPPMPGHHGTANGLNVMQRH
jgi:hypothetical protein